MFHSFLQRTSLVVLVLVFSSIASSQDRREPGHARRIAGPTSTTSPFTPPEANDYTFVINDGPGLDTGCSFRSDGPLRITLPIGRVLGEIAKLRANGLVPATVRLEFPAFDVDSAGAPGVPPERDRVTFIGKDNVAHVVPGEFTTGINDEWIKQRFNIPIEWLNLPNDPGEHGTVSPANNEIRIDIDTASGADENWCTAVDWVTITIDPIPPRPWIGAHGIFSNSGIWNTLWVPRIKDLGIPAAAGPDMGRLDTIGNNAAKISAAVAEARARWGVDRVNIVAHSKGGLDSRDYIENTDTIDNLVQLGTPNAGSPLADVVQAGAISLLGLDNSVEANELAGGLGGYQLTTPYMTVYNFFHGSNPKVKYMAIGGVQTPGDFSSDPFGVILQSIVGSGDLIVPLSSVHALSFTTDRTVFSTFPPTFGLASHTGIHQNPVAFAFGKSLVTSPGRRSNSLSGFGVPTSFGQSLKSVNSGSSTPERQRTQTFGGKLQQPQTASHVVAVDSAATLTFTLLHAADGLDLKLTDPNGQVFDPMTIAGRSDVSRQELAIPGGFGEAYSFNGSFATGNWTATVTATNTTGPVDYTLNAWLEGAPLQMTAAVDRVSAPLGGTFVLTTKLLNGTLPISGATVHATVRLPDRVTLANVTLTDDGHAPDAVANDGTYSGAYSGTTQTGAYGVAIDASGPASGPFTREDYLSLFVTASSSTILDGITDVGRDLNANGLFDQLVLNVPVQITAPGTYRLAATLVDSAGNILESSNSFSLSSASTSAELVFDGQTLFAHGVNGPYHITSVRMAEERNQLVLPLTETTSVYNTAPYAFTAFEGAGMALSGVNSAIGVDTNGNGKFDLLQADIGVRVRTAGSYDWTARLRDLLGREITLAGKSGNLTVGVNSIRLQFDGSAIGHNGVDGPFSITDLLLFGPDTLSVADVFSSPPMAASDFEGFVAPAMAVQFSAANYSVAENEHSVAVSVTRTGLTAPEVSVNYSTSDGSASERSDYTTTAGVLHFAAGETTKTFNILITDDARVEGNETIQLTLSNAGGGATLGTPKSSLVTVVNDDLGPGALNPNDISESFVRQHYHDFLGREPDAAGLAFWVNNIESCGADARCREVKRIDTSAAFFLSSEFQKTGFYVLRLQRVAFGRDSSSALTRLPYQQFIKDARQVGEGVVIGEPGAEQKLEENRQAYAMQIVASPDFIAKFPSSQTADQFVDALFASAAVVPTIAERQAALVAFNQGDTAGRAAALTSVTDSAAVMTREFSPSFVLMQYHGYLRRNPTDAPDGNDNGYQFWLTKLNQFSGDFRQSEMVKAFIVSGEYRARFGP
jgi:hypothetical protein